MGTSQLQFPTYIHSWQWLKQAVAQLQESCMSWGAPCNHSSSSCARLVVHLSHMAPFLLLNHKPWASGWTTAQTYAVAVFSVVLQQQLCTPKHFPAGGEPLAKKRKQQLLPSPTKGGHHHKDVAKLTARSCGTASLRAGTPNVTICLHSFL